MEGDSLLERARRAQRQALDEKMACTQRSIEIEWKTAGPNPITEDNKLLEECVEYLELKVMERASLGYSDVVVPYTHVPAMQTRFQTTRKLSYIVEMDTRAMVNAIVDAFKSKHCDLRLRMDGQYLSNSFHISWN